MRVARCAALSLALCLPAGAQEPVQIGDWLATVAVDRLDPKKTTSMIGSRSEQPIRQFGRESHAHLWVMCGPDGITKRTHLAWSVTFRETVSIGERWVRWRVDDGKVEGRKTESYGDGRIFYLYNSFGPDSTIAAMRKGKMLRSEFDLPWAGNTLLEFKIGGGAEAIGKLPCRDRPKS